MVGDVLATNRAMLSLAQSQGFRAVRHPDGGAQVLRVQRDLHPTLAPVAVPTAPALSAPPESART
jgi:hypothetical protein